MATLDIDDSLATLTNLLTAFEEMALGPPADLTAFIQGRPPTEQLPLPWEAWTLINLVHYRARQFWAKGLVFGHLLREVPDFEKALRKKHRLEGFVPQQPEWQFDLDGLNGTCLLLNRVTNERVMVGTTDYNEADVGLDSDDFLASFAIGRTVEANSIGVRLQELHPSGASLAVSLGHLKAMKCFESLPDEMELSCTFERLSDTVLAHSEAITRFSQAWNNPSQRLWLSALIGDWFAVNDYAAMMQMDDVAVLAQQRVEQCRRLRLTLVTDMVERLIQCDTACVPLPAWFHAMNELGRTELPRYLRQSLSMRDAAICALCFIEDRDDPAWCPDVYALFERALRGNVNRDDPRGQVISPVSEECADVDDLLAIRCATFLAKHGYRTAEVTGKLAENEQTLAEVILPVLQYVPDRAMEILRRCMQSSRVHVVHQAAAILALIGGPESERLCLAAMKESDEPLIVAYSQMALYVMWDKGPMLFTHEGVRRLLRWARKNQRMVILSDTRGLKKADDPLASSFLETVASLSPTVMTHRGKVLANAKTSGGLVAPAAN